MFKQSDIGIELGNSKFSLCVRGAGVVATEAAFLAYRGNSLEPSSLVAYGNEALEMHERSHPGIKVISPMREGVVIDCRASGMILAHMAKKAGIGFRWAKPRVLVSTLLGASAIERKAFVDAVEFLRAKKSAAVHEPLAAANSLPIDIASPYANMLVDVGDGATEALIVSLGQTVQGSSIRFGGSHVNALIVDHIRKKHDLRISLSQAKRLKESIGNDNNHDETLIVRGLSTKGFLPTEKQIKIKDLFPVIDHTADVIADFVLSTLAKVPPAVSVDLIENGIHLCGGASRILRLKERIMDKTRLTVNTVENPEASVSQGLVQMLRFSDRFS